MRSKQPKRPSGGSLAQRQGWRRSLTQVAVLASVFFMIIFVAGAYMSGAIKLPQSSQSGTAAAPPSNPMEHRVGSILFMPVVGSKCEERRFDNATGRMISMGTVDCDDALAAGDHAPATTGSRLRAITSAFKPQEPR